MRILIIELSLGGHHGPYLVWIVHALRSAGHHVTLAIGSKESVHPLYAPLTAASDRFIEISDTVCSDFGKPDRGFVDMWKIQMGYRRLFGDVHRVATRDSDVDLVLLPYLDYCTYAFSVFGAPFGATAWSAIIMRPAFHYAAMGVRAPVGRGDTPKARLFGRLLRERRLTALFTIDESLTTYCRSRNIGTHRLHLLRDPVPLPIDESTNENSLRNELGIAADATVVTCYGSLSSRKGIQQLLSALNDPNCPGSVHVLLAGKQEADAKATLDSPLADNLRAQGRLHEINRFVSDADEDRILSCGDVMWAGYVGHLQMSAAIVHAGMYAMPSIGCNEGLVGWLIDHHNCGITVDVQDCAAVTQALRRLHDDREGREQMGLNGKAVFAAHAIPRVAADFVAALGGGK